ncbi:uncharacterized protein LOC113272721 [Papaver somniferum]|uniref:uncharacterized protein LOC113272721 n=1 Tax=Papaver somniferum TaxID=3469 RepID=UPI000E7045FB|nr:uncharacterized protein LOC113272721 [Papaver somniferum]
MVTGGCPPLVPLAPHPDGGVAVSMVTNGGVTLEDMLGFVAALALVIGGVMPTGLSPAPLVLVVEEAVPLDVLITFCTFWCPRNTSVNQNKSEMENLRNENNFQKIPSIELPDDLFEKSLDPWKFSLIRRLDLQKIKFVDVAIILRSQWKLQGDCRLIPLGRGFFTIKLDNEQDKQLIKSQRWEVLNQILQVRNWIYNFRPASQRTSKAMVWVRFPGLGLEFWNESILFKICREFGTPIKIDNATSRCEVGYYANVLVEVDFAQHIPNKVWIGTKCGFFFQDVLIPDCPKYCSNCKIVGHLNTES